MVLMWVLCVMNELFLSHLVHFVSIQEVLIFRVSSIILCVCVCNYKNCVPRDQFLVQK